MKNENLKWGIIGLGKIAHNFVKDFFLVQDATLRAVASRSLKKAKSFAADYNIQEAYGSYQALFDDPKIDVIYIATPHNSHMDLSIQAMKAGKHVLCEKPLAINKSQVKKMLAVAKQNKVFLMEAFWSRFNPTIIEVSEKIKNGVIGDVNYLNADFNFKATFDPNSRLFDPELAGGALLDVGVYPIFLAYLLFGKPKSIAASSLFSETGVDVQTAMQFKFENRLANLMCGLNSKSDMIAKIHGEKGSIFIDARWHEASGYRIEKNEESTQHSKPKLGKGYAYEIMECINCISLGNIESKSWSHQDSMNLISICDEVRKLIGLKYPFE